VVIGAVVLLRSQKVHEYVLRVAQQKASAALNTEVRVREFTLRFSAISPTVDLYDVVVAGAAPYSKTPLLQAEHIGVAVRVTSIIHRTWYLNDLRIDHPVAQVFVDKNGANNLPTLKSSGQSHTSVFDLGIRHALLDHGEVYYNDRKSVLQADLHDVQFRSGFTPAPKEYSGTLGYRDGHLRFGACNPITHDLEARFSANPSSFTLQRAVLTVAPSQFVLSATVEDYNQPRVQARYDGTIDAGQFRRILKNPSLPQGVIRLAGTLQYASVPNRPVLDTVTLSGNVGSRSLQVRTQQYAGEIRDLAARYVLQNGNLDVRDMRARVLGGDLTANMMMRDITGKTRSQLQAALRNVSLAELKPMMNSPSLQDVALAGTVNADAMATWGKAFNDLVAHTDVTVQASFAPGTNPANAVPLNAVVHANYAAPRKQIAFSQSYVRMPQTTLALNGTVSDRTSLQVNLQSRNLHELENIANLFRKPTQPFGLYGTASFAGAVSGSTSTPQIVGQLTGSNVRVKDGIWRLVCANVKVSPTMMSLQNGVVQPADRGQITFNLSAGLRHYSISATSPVQISLNASQINVADFARAAGVQILVSGTLGANATLRGSQLNPVGQGTINLTRAVVSGQPVQTANLRFNGNGEQVQGNLTVRLPAGTAQSTFTILPKQKAYEVQLTAHAIQLAQLQAMKARKLNIAGALNVDASGRGTFDNPELQAIVQAPQLRIQNQTINQLSLRTTVADHVAEVALDSQMVNTALRGHARINLTGAYYTDATLDTLPIPLQPLVAMYAPSQAGNISGQTELHATLRGPLKNKAQLDAHIVLPTLQVNYGNTVQVAAANPIRVDYANGVLALQRTAIRGTGTDLQLQGTIPTVDNMPVSLLLLGTVDLRVAQLFNPDIASSGQLRFNINSFGQRSNPDVQGQVEIANASFASGDLPIGLQNGNGTLTLTKNRLDITRFQGTVGGGTVRAQGGIVYRPELRFDLALSGRGMRFLYPRGVREALDTDLSLAGTADSSLLRGQVRIAQLAFTPDFDLTNFLGQLTSNITPPPTQGFTQNLRLNLGVQSTSGLNLVSRTMSFQGTANLRVQGTVADPVVLGRVNINGGDAVFNGHRFVLQEGTIDFVNPTLTQPVLNVSANTTIEQYNIQLRFAGPVDHMRTYYTSDPGLPQSDIISLLAFGKTTEASAANPAPGNLAAESAVASQVSNQVTSRVEKIAGISQLSVDPLLGCDQQAKGGCVTVRQRVTGQIFLTFQADVTSTQRDSLQLEYQHTPRVSFSGTRDQNGGFGFDARIRKTW
jgi:translocation and assembly module TamB